MRRIHISSIAFALLLLPLPLHAEYFATGHPACVSKEKLDEFLALAQSKSTEIYRYINMHWCIYPQDAVIRVLSLTSDDKAEVQFNIDGQDVRLWVSIRSITRLKRRPLENVVIEDSDNPDIKDLCTMLSNFTHLNNVQSRKIAETIVDVQEVRPDSAQAKRYTNGLATNTYELVVDWDGQHCIGELDVPKTQIVGCVLDARKYYQCRRKQKEESSQCYIDLCTERLPPNEPH